MARVQKIAFKDMCREHPQLTGCAPCFTAQTCVWQAGFLGTDQGQCVDTGVNLVRDRIQEGRAILRCGGAVGVKRILGSLRGAVDQINGAGGENPWLPVGGVG